MQEKEKLFSGSFDPITIGHIDLVKRALPLFDEIIIAIGINSQKQTLFELEMRKNGLKMHLVENRVRVDTFQGLTVHYCKRQMQGL